MNDTRFVEEAQGACAVLLLAANTLYHLEHMLIIL